MGLGVRCIGTWSVLPRLGFTDGYHRVILTRTWISYETERARSLRGGRRRR